MFKKKKILLRFVPHKIIDEYKKNGWEIVRYLQNSHHGEYAVIMQKININ